MLQILGTVLILVTLYGSDLEELGTQV